MKLSKRTRIIILILFVAIGATNQCECDDENEADDIDIVGTWILRSAEFSYGETDLDGDGPMLPMSDVKYFLLDLLDVYADCSSIEDIPIQFSEEVASHTPPGYYVYAVCPEGMGVTSQIGIWIKYSSQNTFALKKEELNDPGNLIDWDGDTEVLLTDQFTEGSKRILHGSTFLKSKVLSDNHPIFFVLEEYMGE